MNIKNRWLPLGALGAGALFAAASVHVKSSNDYNAALEHYRIRAHGEALIAAHEVASAFDQIYQNLRTISLLSSVRKIDRYGETLSPDGRQSIQQIFNNLANNIAVSEVYVVPADLQPDEVDPKTNEKQAPILMFDKVRLYRGPLAVSILLTLLFGLLHWKPLSDARAAATD